MGSNRYAHAYFQDRKLANDFLNRNEIARSRIVELSAFGGQWELIYENDLRYFFGDVLIGPNIRGHVYASGQSYFTAADPGGNVNGQLSVSAQPYANELATNGTTMTRLTSATEQPTIVAMNELASKQPRFRQNFILSNGATGGAAIADLHAPSTNFTARITDLANAITAIGQARTVAIGMLLNGAGFTDLGAGGQSLAQAQGILDDYTAWRREWEYAAVARTGQTKGVPLITHQFPWWAVGATPGFGFMPFEQRQRINEEGIFLLPGLNFGTRYGADNVHHPAPVYQTLGELYAMVLDLVAFRGFAWKPPHITEVRIDPSNSSRLIVTVFCPARAFGLEDPTEPNALIIDTNANLFTLAGSPSTVRSTVAAAPGHGFSYTGSPARTVTGVTYGGTVGPASAILYVTLSGPAAAGNTLDYVVTMADPPNHITGNIRDNFLWTSRLGRSLKCFLLSDRQTILA